MVDGEVCTEQPNHPGQLPGAVARPAREKTIGNTDEAFTFFRSSAIIACVRDGSKDELRLCLNQSCKVSSISPLTGPSSQDRPALETMAS